VHAAAPTLIHRASKFYRRHRLATTAGLLLFLAVASGATLSTIGFLRAAEAQRIAEHEAMVATETSRFLTQALAVAEPGELEGRETTVREILDLAQSRLDAQPAEAPEVEARLRYVLGASYASLGQYAQALANLLRAGELREQSAGATVEQAAQALTTLSDLLASRGQFVLAQILNEELARLYAAGYGAQSSQYALVQVRIGTLFNQLGARSQARDRLAAAQVIERTLPEADPALANAIKELIQAIEQH
jgi:serine/threonine-protein kinase